MPQHGIAGIAAASLGSFSALWPSLASAEPAECESTNKSTNKSTDLSNFVKRQLIKLFPTIWLSQLGSQRQLVNVPLVPRVDFVACPKCGLADSSCCADPETVTMRGFYAFCIGFDSVCIDLQCFTGFCCLPVEELKNNGFAPS